MIHIYQKDLYMLLYCICYYK